MRAYALANGKILSGFERGKPVWSTGAAIEEGRVAYIGDYPEARVGPATRVIDLEGRVVLPGLVDAHLHLASLGMSLETLDLRGVGSIEELKEKIRRAASTRGGGEWILGRGWDQENFKERRMPTRWDLDEAAPHHPVLIVRVCGHLAVANTRALQMAGVTDETPDPPGGVIERRNGSITGVLKEAAVGLVAGAVPSSPGARARQIQRAMRALASVGVTTVCAMSIDETELEALGLIERPLIRVRAYVTPDLMAAKPRFSSELLEVRGVKIFLDGSFGARTAALREPYSDDPGNRGMLQYSDEELLRLLNQAAEAGVEVAAHAIGDAALEQLVETLRRLDEGPRVRVEHCSLAPPELVAELASLDVGVSIQPRFVISDWWIVDRLGERSRWVYPFKTMLNAGLTVASSSDAPVEPFSPWEGLYAAVTRGRWEGVRLASLTPGEALTNSEALLTYTHMAATLLGEDVGVLRPGGPADFIVVDADPLSLPARRLREVRVLETYVGGVRVWP